MNSRWNWKTSGGANSRGITRIVLFILLMAGSVLGVTNDFSSLVVEGSIRRTNFAFGPPREIARARFKVLVEGCNWKIITSNEVPGAATTYWETGISNKQIYQISHLAASAIGSNSYNTVIAQIGPESVPLERKRNPIGEVWLTYCAQCIIEGTTNGTLPPVAGMADADWEKKKFSFSAAFLDAQALFPKRISYWDDGVVRGMSERGAIVIKLPPPFDRGYERAILEALTATNVLGTLVPVTAVWNEYLPEIDSLGKSAALRTINQTLIVADYIAIPKEVPGGLLPLLVKPALIEDFVNRGSDGPPSIVYISKTGWVSADSPIIAKVRERQTREYRERMLKQPPRLPGKSWFLIIVIGLVILAPVITFAVGRRQKIGKNNIKNK